MLSSPVESVAPPPPPVSPGTGPCPLCGSTDAAPRCGAPDRFHGRKQPFRLARCRACSGVWLPDPPRPEEMFLHYDEEYHRAITQAGESDLFERWRRPRELISRHCRSGSLLDIGCSSGAFLSTLRGGDWKLHGIEMEPETAAKARLRTGAQVFVGDVMGAPFAEGAFDVITCFDLLEHVYDPRLFLARVHRWLKPGGILCAVMPNIESWEARLFGSYWYGLELPRHLFHFSPRSLRRLLTSLEFTERHLETNTSYAERSAGYVTAALLGGAGFQPPPPSAPRTPGIAWRGVRKLLRLTLVRPFSAVASLAGAGASMEIVFSKNAR